MNQKFKMALCFAVAIASAGQCFAADDLTSAKVGWLAGKRVGPGTIYASENLTSGPLNFCVLKVDLENPHISIEAEPGHDHLFAGE